MKKKLFHHILSYIHAYYTCIVLQGSIISGAKKSYHVKATPTKLFRILVEISFVLRFIRCILVFFSLSLILIAHNLKCANLHHACPRFWIFHKELRDGIILNPPTELQDSSPSHLHLHPRQHYRGIIRRLVYGGPPALV